MLHIDVKIYWYAQSQSAQSPLPDDTQLKPSSTSLHPLPNYSTNAPIVQMLSDTLLRRCTRAPMVSIFLDPTNTKSNLLSYKCASGDFG